MINSRSMKKIILIAVVAVLTVFLTACHAFKLTTEPDGSRSVELTPEAEYVVENTLEKAAESDGILGWLATGALGVFNLYQYRKGRRKGKTASVAVAGTSLILDAIKERSEKQEAAPSYDELISLLKTYQEQEKAREDIRKELAKQKPATTKEKSCDAAADSVAS